MCCCCCVVLLLGCRLSSSTPLKLKRPILTQQLSCERRYIQGLSQLRCASNFGFIPIVPRITWVGTAIYEVEEEMKLRSEFLPLGRRHALPKLHVQQNGTAPTLRNHGGRINCRPPYKPSLGHRSTVSGITREQSRTGATESSRNVRLSTGCVPPRPSRPTSERRLPASSACQALGRRGRAAHLIV